GRYRVTAKVSYLAAGTDRERTHEVSTRNLSRTGLSFIHKSLIYPRQKVGVELPLPDHSVRMFRGKVVRVRPAGVGLYEIGVEFTELHVVMG
ncbi:MAG TPA: PilZ domain-containing protein, partial [Phycisphaerae bacterium]